MENIDDSININASISLSRNMPVALIVGAAGFIGSHLTERLLKVGVQVIGIDDFSTSQRGHLAGVLENRHFHLLSQSITHQVTLRLPRLDYAFFVADSANPDLIRLYRYGIPSFLNFVKDYRAKLLLVTSILLYEKPADVSEQSVIWAENLFAGFIRDHHLNGRIVRLPAVFGPRMHFRGNDPLTNLIRLAAEHKLQSYTPISVFSSRALFVTDAVNLLVKSVFVGATANKVYDGAALEPVRLDEAANLLLNLQFGREVYLQLTKLPIWPTPNLEKTVKELAWRPKAPLAQALKSTLEYLKDTGYIEVVSSDVPANKEQPKNQEQAAGETTKPHSRIQGLSSLLLAVFIAACLLGFPILNSYWWSRWGTDVSNTLNLVREGNLAQALQNTRSLGWEVRAWSFPVDLLNSLRGLPGVGVEINGLDDSLATKQAQARGLEYLIAGERTVTSGWGGGESQITVLKSLPEFEAALFYLQSLPESDAKVIDLLQGWVSLLSLVSVTPFKDASYLVTVTGEGEQSSLIESIGEIENKAGSPGLKFEPSADFLIRTASSSGITAATFWQGSDFPSFAQGLINLAGEGSNQNPRGVISLSINTLSKMVDAESGVTLPGSGQRLSGAEMESQLASLSEAQAGAFLARVATAVWQQALSPSFNLNLLVDVWYDSLNSGESKLYINQSAALSFLTARDWAGSLSPLQSSKDQVGDFLAVQDKILAVSRTQFGLQTEMDKTGEVVDTLRLTYQNNSLSEISDVPITATVPEGVSVTQATWGGEDISGELTQNSQLGRSILTIPVSLKAGKAKELVVAYQLPDALSFDLARLPAALYTWEVVPQPGEVSNARISWQLGLPAGWQAKSPDSSLAISDEPSAPLALPLTTRHVIEIYVFK